MEGAGTVWFVPSRTAVFFVWCPGLLWVIYISMPVPETSGRSVPNTQPTASITLNHLAFAYDVAGCRAFFPAFKWQTLENLVQWNMVIRGIPVFSTYFVSCNSEGAACIYNGFLCAVFKPQPDLARRGYALIKQFTWYYSLDNIWEARQTKDDETWNQSLRWNLYMVCIGR